MKSVHLDHLAEMVNKFEQETDDYFEWKDQKKKKYPPINGLIVDEDINF